jgi:single-strand DNA-binding protein
MLNKFMAIGNLTVDPESKKIGEDKIVCKFSLAINNRVNDTVTFIDVETWNKSAENCKRFLSKGRRVLVEGRIQLNKWKSPSGENRNKLFCVADVVTFLDKSDSPAEPPQQNEVKKESPAEEAEDDEFAEVPF